MEISFILALLFLSAHIAVSFTHRRWPVSSIAKTKMRHSPVFHSPAETMEPTRTTAVSFTVDAINKMNSLHRDRVHADTIHGINDNIAADDICFRVGIKDGGCIGMSYVVQPINRSDITREDLVEVHETITCAIDKFSLIYIEGMLIDYQEHLRPDGDQPGFAFKNPLASSSW